MKECKKKALSIAFKKAAECVGVGALFGVLLGGYFAYGEKNPAMIFLGTTLALSAMGTGAGVIRGTIEGVKEYRSLKK